MSFLHTFNIISSYIAAYLLHLLHPRTTQVEYVWYYDQYRCIERLICHCGHDNHWNECSVEDCSCGRTCGCNEWGCKECDPWSNRPLNDYEVKCWVVEETESTSELIDEAPDPRIADLLDLIDSIEEGFAVDDDDEYDGDIETPRPFVPFIDYTRVEKLDDDEDDDGRLTPDSVLVRVEFDDDSFFNLPS